MTTDLPEGWRLAKVSQLCDYNPRHPRDTPDETTVSFIPMSAVDDQTGAIVELEERSFGEVKRGYTHFAEGDVIWAKITPCMENGKAAVARGLTNGMACGSTEFVVLRPRDGLDPRWLHRFMRQETYRRAARRTMKSGVGQARVPKSFVLDTEFPLPPPDEQQRVLARIESLQARSRRAKEALDAIPPLLERFRQSVLAAAFRGDLTADWRRKNPDVEPASVLLERIRAERKRRWIDAEAEKARGKAEARAQKAGKPWTEADGRKALEAGRKRAEKRYKEPEPVDTEGLPELPAGWSWVSAQQICWEITVGHVGPMKDRYVPEGVPFLRSQNVRANRFDERGLLYIDATFDEELRKSRLRPGDVLVVRSGAPGTACVLPESIPSANCADLVISRPVTGIEPELLAYFINSKGSVAQIRDAQVGVAQQHFNVGSMKKLVIPLIPVSEQRALLDRLHAAEKRNRDVSAAVEQGTRRVARLDQSVLAIAFRGELLPPTQES